MGILMRTWSAAGTPGQLWSAAPPHPVPWRWGWWPAWPSGRTETRWGASKRTTLMGGERHVDTASYPVFADHCPNLLFCPPLPLLCRSQCWGRGASAGSRDSQQSWAAPSPSSSWTSHPHQLGPWSKHRRPQCGRNFQAGSWGEALSRRCGGWSARRPPGRSRKCGEGRGGMGQKFEKLRLFCGRWPLLIYPSSSVVPFSSRPQSFPASGSFPMSQLFASGGQRIGVSASASVLPVNIQD